MDAGAKLILHGNPGDNPEELSRAVISLKFNPYFPPDQSASFPPDQSTSTFFK
jgi:hypothetical protein